jgi:predicted Fe-S protein YdhL (DUF1289 family)
MTATLTAKDFASDQEVRWCPGCGDYAILKAMQRTLAEIGAWSGMSEGEQAAVLDQLEPRRQASLQRDTNPKTSTPRMPE